MHSIDIVVGNEATNIIGMTNRKREKTEKNEKKKRKKNIYIYKMRGKFEEYLTHTRL